MLLILMHLPLSQLKKVLNQPRKSILELGKIIKKMESADKIMLVLVTTMETGSLEKKKEKVWWSMLIKTSIQANGRKERKTDKAHIYSKPQRWNSSVNSELAILLVVSGTIQMGPTSKVTLIIISQREWVTGISKMEIRFKVCIIRPREWTQMSMRLNFHGKPLLTLQLDK